MTPELVQEVDIINGPFNAEYGDFSGLGVVHIRLKESLPEQFNFRMQGGSFGSYRTFLGYSPKLKNVDSFLAYEGSRTNGPFLNPLHYKRDNLTANYTWHLGEKRSLGFKISGGRNDFFSSGQLPLDEVAAGWLDRFGFVDPSDGGRVWSGTLATYYSRELNSGDTLKIDGFLSRSLFDLYSNFTFFLKDPVRGDGFVYRCRCPMPQNERVVVKDDLAKCFVDLEAFLRISDCRLELGNAIFCPAQLGGEPGVC